MVKCWFGGYIGGGFKNNIYKFIYIILIILLYILWINPDCADDF